MVVPPDACYSTLRSLIIETPQRLHGLLDLPYSGPRRYPKTYFDGQARDGALGGRESCYAVGCLDSEICTFSQDLPAIDEN
jgi:hypothetical protein